MDPSGNMKVRMLVKIPVLAPDMEPKPHSFVDLPGLETIRAFNVDH